MLPAYLDKLYSEQLITSEEYTALKKQHQQPVSLFTDLHVLLYAGILLLSTGIGILIYKNIDSLGHEAVVIIIALLCIACFVYCLKKSPGFSPVRQVSVNTISGYILLLGCLLMLTLAAYLQYQYTLFGNHWGLAVFVPMVLLFLSAYYFDHVGVLSLAVTNLAAWAGLTVTPINILKSNDFSNPHLLFTGMVLGAGLFLIAYASVKKNFKAHFAFTYRNFSIHLSYISLLAAMFYYENFYFLWFLSIAVLTAFICRYTLNIKSFYFFITAVLYCYIAICSVIYNLVFLLNDEAGFYLYIIWFIVSGIALMRVFIHYNKIIKRMHAYANKDLNNFHIQEQAEEAYEQGIISEGSLNTIKQQHPYSFYRAGAFVRIALALLTVVCIVFAALLLFLLMRDADNFSALFLVMLIACYGLLEYMVKTKKYYNAGIDNTLQLFTIIFFAGLFFNGDYAYQDIVITIAVLVAAVWLCVRFTDAFMALVGFAAFLVLIFFLAQHNNNVLYMPFISMLASATIYFLQYWLQTKQQLHFYEKGFSMLSIAALIIFYASSNVYIVIEVSKQSSIQGVDAPAAYITIYWILSVIIPFAYLMFGFMKRRSVFVRIGFLSFCATIVTIYYYASFLSLEIALIIAGCVLTGLGYAGMKYFKNNKFGFIATSFTSLNNNLIAAETLISIQFGGKQASQKNIEFGGGSTGGAGASGNW